MTEQLFDVATATTAAWDRINWTDTLSTATATSAETADTSVSGVRTRLTKQPVCHITAERIQENGRTDVMSVERRSSRLIP